MSPNAKIACYDPSASMLAVISGSPAVDPSNSPSPHIAYNFVDIDVFTREGMVIEAGIQLPAGTELDFMFYDRGPDLWRQFRVEVTECVPMNENLFTIGCRVTAEEGEGDLAFLMRTNILNTLPHHDFLRLINCLEKREPAAGDALFRQGEEGNYLYIIQSGEFSMHMTDDEGFHPLGTLRSGDQTGELAVLTGERRIASVTAETAGTAWALARERFEQLEADHPDLRSFLTELITEYFLNCPATAERRIGKYRVGRRLESGGWGIVYDGRHDTLNMQVAVKMLKHDMALEEMFKKTFRAEAKIIARLNHPNIVRVYDIEEVFRTIFIMMEFLYGQSLKDVLRNNGRLPAERIIYMLTQVMSGLHYAHEQGIVHRDIKPDNIYVLDGDHVKILDFGLACAPGTEDFSMAGTVEYAPPEQIEGDPVTPRSDLFSSGIMAYEMATGKMPFPNATAMELTDLYCDEDIPDPALLVPDIPENLRSFILTCCRRNPEERYATAEEAMEALQNGHGGLHNEKLLTTLYLSYDSDKRLELAKLLEEFGDRARELGVKMQLVDLEGL